MGKKLYEKFKELVMEPKTYLQNTNFQKSYTFLWPLIGFKKNDSIKPKETYLFWTEADYSIDDYNLITYYETDFNHNFLKFENENILTKDNLLACFKVQGGMVYVWDLIYFSNTVAEFVQGRYSKFTEKDKKIIMTYFGGADDKTVRPGRLAYMGLYPEEFYDVVGQELNVEKKYLTELVKKYDVEDEICHLPIIEDVNCCPDKTTYYLGKQKK